MKTATWGRPHDVDDATAAFPASVVGTLLPPADDIPDGFWKHRRNVWTRLVSQWFCSGLSSFEVRDGIDPDAARRHLEACLGSFQPKHEHKEAGVAYLMSLWCDEGWAKREVGS